MNETLASLPQPLLVSILQILGVVAPAIYSGITFAYSSIVVPPLISHASPKLLAKQWLQAYQYGPKFVPPLIMGGTLCNVALAYMSRVPNSRYMYIAAATMTISIMPYTVLYMEPNVNGAGKWKVQELLRDEGFVLEENGKGMPRVDRHTATLDARKWAEGRTMRQIVERWSVVNERRWYITAFATVASAIGTCRWT